jgi:hypothetical protein
MAALTTMDSTATPSFSRFHSKTAPFQSLKMGCLFRDTTAPTKEGLSGDNKIVSNLHKQNQPLGHLGITLTHHYGARQHSYCRIVVIAACPNRYPR